MDDSSKSLPSNYVKGYCYFDVRDGKFWVDTSDAASGRLALNAVKADQLATARTIALTGDVTGSAAFDGSGNISITTVVADSSHNHAASNITSGTIAAARLPTATTSTIGIVKIGTGIAVSSGTISNSGVRSIATGSTNGTISVNTNGTSADVAVKGLGTLAYSSATYAGGTAITLNGASKAGATASFFAPTTVGTAGQFLKSNGSGAPVWANVSTVGLVHVGSAAPSTTDYVLWVDEDEDSGAAMPNDAIKYKTFSIATSAWSGSGPYTYSMTATGVTANTAIINLTLDAASQTYQKAQLDWETGANIITLSTATKPTGTLTGYLIAVQVMEI